MVPVDERVETVPERVNVPFAAVTVVMVGYSANLTVAPLIPADVVLSTTVPVTVIVWAETDRQSSRPLIDNLAACINVVLFIDVLLRQMLQTLLVYAGNLRAKTMP
jgi:hypothetical protein